MSSFLRKAERKREKQQENRNFFYIQHFYPSKTEEAEKRVLAFIKKIGVSYWSFKDGSKEIIIKTPKPLQTPQTLYCQITGEEIGFIRPATSEEVEETEKASKNIVK